jgi:hypothetical protein
VEISCLLYAKSSNELAASNTNPRKLNLQSFPNSFTVILEMVSLLKRSMQPVAGRTAGGWCVVVYPTQATKLVFGGLFSSHLSSRLGNDESGGGTG